MTTCAIMQPTVLPWMGYFELMLRSDVFVFLDDVQLERKSFQTRNRIKGPNGPIWLRVPLKHGPRDQRICEAEIDNSQSWQRDHWLSIQSVYAKAPHASLLWTDLEDLWLAKWDSLAEFTERVIYRLACLLGWTGRFENSQCMDLRPGKEDHIIDVCRAVGATELYDAAGAEAILDPEPFREAGIKLTFQRYEHPEYRQLHGPFVPYMSALDCILNEGSAARDIILSGGQARWAV